MISSPAEVAGRALLAPYVVVDIGSQERPLVTVARRSLFPADTLWVCVEKDPWYASAGGNKVPEADDTVHVVVEHAQAATPDWGIPAGHADEVYFGNVLGEPHTDESTWDVRIRSGSKQADKQAAMKHGWSILRSGGCLVVFEDITPDTETTRSLVAETLAGCDEVITASHDEWAGLMDRYHTNYETTPPSVMRRTGAVRNTGQDDPPFFIRCVKP